MRLDRLVAPGVGFLAALALLVAGRIYEGWSVKPAPCSLRVLTGVPCIACGGTRAVKALSHGEIAQACQFNPLVVIGLFAVMFWFVWTVATMRMARYRQGAVSDAQNRSRGNPAKRWGFAMVVLVLLNWVYLVFFLPP